MKKTLLLSIIATCLALQGAYSQEFAGGSGTEADPWQVETLNHLNNLRNYLGDENADKFFIQTSDINATETETWEDGAGFSPIGGENYFSGHYNGDGYMISDLFINRPDDDNVGLFGYTKNATLIDIHLENINIEGDITVGGIVGYLLESTITNSSTSALNTLITGNGNTGGLIGKSYFGTIENCNTAGSVQSTGIGTGGLVGENSFYSVINNSFSDADIFSSSWGVGGLVGNNMSPVNNCYATGEVNGGSRTGGLIGKHKNSVNMSYSLGDVNGNSFMVGGLIGDIDVGTISNCYAHGHVTVNGTAQQIGGFAGYNNDASITNCYSIGSITGGSENIGGFIGENTGLINNSYWDLNNSSIANSNGGEGKTTQEMMQQATFENWDFDNYWTIDESISYPYLGDFEWERYQLTFNAFDAFDDPINGAQLEITNDQTWFQGGGFFTTAGDGSAEMMVPNYGTYSYDGYFYYMDNHPEFETYVFFYLGEGSFNMEGEDKTIEIRLSLITFTVKDNNTDTPIEGAEINIFQPQTETFQTNEQGVGRTQSGNGTYGYIVSAEGYGTTDTLYLDINNEDIEIEVNLESKPSYSVSIDALPANNTGGLIEGAGVYFEDEEVSITASPNVSFTFEHWLNEDEEIVSTDAEHTFVLSSDRHFTAVFNSETYNITTQANDIAFGQTNGDGTYYENEVVVLEAEPETAYRFLRWLDNDTGEQLSVVNPYMFSASQNLNVVAQFVEDWEYTGKNESSLITAEAQPNNIGVVLNQGHHDDGETITLTASPNAGLNFVKWTENGTDLEDTPGNLVGAEYTFQVNGDRNLVAIFDGDNYNINVTAENEDSGDVNGAGNYYKGDFVMLDATPSEGFTLEKWTWNDNQISVNPSFGFTVLENRDIVAHFEALSLYNLNLQVSPSNAGTVDGAGEYYKDAIVDIVATANEGFQFVNWTGNIEYLDNPDSESTTVTMPQGTLTLRANFEDDGSSIESLSNTNIKIYPNPTNNKYTIESNENIVRIQLIDISGKQVKNNLVDGLSHELNVQNLPAGMYFIKVYTGNNVITKKVQIAR